MKNRHADAPIGLIRSKAISEEFIARAKELGCSQIAPLMEGSTAELVKKAHDEGLRVTLWMVQSIADWNKAKELGADNCTSDYPILLLQRVKGKKKKLVALDLDATLCQHRTPVPSNNVEVLKKLQEKYHCVMVGAGNAPRIYRQMNQYPIEIIGNYGMQEAAIVDGKFKIVRAVTNTVDKKFFLEKTNYLRKKYGYTEYSGKPVEFHASGMVTFGLLGTSAEAEQKVTFDPNRKKRRAMYPEVCEIFKDFSVYIGGSTSFDFAGKEYNKYDAVVNWAKRRGYEVEDIVFVGDDFADGGGDSHTRIKGMDLIVINDYRCFPQAMAVLLED
jgi:hydroxymethylpyrimidine pyrophosphatase-like HAD family hydrolase